MQVVALPRKPCVRQVLHDFIKFKAQSSEEMLQVEKEILKDMNDSLLSYFDKALGMCETERKRESAHVHQKEEEGGRKGERKSSRS